MLCLFVLLFIIQKHNPPKKYKMHHQKKRFSIIIGFQNTNDFHGFGSSVVWL